MTTGTTGITTLSQDSFSRIDALLTRARETTETKRSALDTAGQVGQAGLAGQAAQGVQTSAVAVPTAEADQAYSSVMDMLSAPSSDAHRSLDPERVARLLNL
ncbi:hypothetical protein RVX_R31030 [Nitratidesulfovibrio sp. HK-II]|uniref:hypothetical protein n=1 Tax=Nitratidesulfovibrio sp. HK-II TaxID=2009266 RepID=UPI000E2EEFFB|nr:hypothetical protein [Nitratidesulfovibrio sp. HK-II]GBO97719.1 hypothetical protein RVX_2758 [Nitratidesulfovibrio sp. HK-II]GBO98221.1 hypothetical protein RVX_3260 [Nitratidesulfovibrio sp. HK-II]